MNRFLKNLKEELEETSDLHPTVTVKRSDLENLVKAYEKQQTMDSAELEAVIRALRYFESDFGMTDKERALYNRLQNDLKEVK